MPNHNSMKIFILQGLLWLYLLIGLDNHMALSLEPGFLDFDNLPDTNFSCVGKVIGGYYADLETNCQMFHVCTIGQLDEPMDIRFLCLNGTVFDQETRVCERIDEVDCTKSEQFYSLNLELYGNTQPSILEESPETEAPIIIKSTTTTTTTTTTSRPKPTKQQYYTTATSPIVVTTSPKVISTHHFPINSQQTDIRFNPEEINIRLNPSGVLTNIHTKTVPFHQEIYANSDISNNNNKKEIELTTPPTPPKSVVSYGLTHNKPATPADYGYTFQEEIKKTDAPPKHNFQYHHHNQNFRLHPYANQFRSTTYHPPQTTQRKVNSVTTYRTPYISSLKPPPYQTQHYRTEKPQRLQLPLPLLPTLPPLSFSSPAPFTLSRHIETKRYTKEHQSPPRIIISASASVSDDSGRRLNYSLGTIGTGQLIESPPTSYEEYKDEVLDPFFHDVPKLKKRSKRNTRVKHSDIIKSEQEAVDVLKFLFDWYKSQEKTDKTEKTTTVSIPLMPEIITDINHKLTTSDPPTTNNIKESDLFKRGSKFNIIGDALSSSTSEDVSDAEETTSFKPPDYVDDNYEPLTYKESEVSNKNNAQEHEINDEKLKYQPPDYVDDNYEPLTYKENAYHDSNSTSNAEGLKKEEENKTNHETSTQKIENIKEYISSSKENTIDINNTTIERPPRVAKTGNSDETNSLSIENKELTNVKKQPDQIKNENYVVHDVDKDQQILQVAAKDNQRNQRRRISSRRRNNQYTTSTTTTTTEKSKYEEDNVEYDVDRDNLNFNKNKDNIGSNPNKILEETVPKYDDEKVLYDVDKDNSRRDKHNLETSVANKEQLIYDNVKEIITTANYEDSNKSEDNHVETETTENYNAIPIELQTTIKEEDEASTESLSALMESVTKLISEYLNPSDSSEERSEESKEENSPNEPFTSEEAEITEKSNVEEVIQLTSNSNEDDTTQNIAPEQDTQNLDIDTLTPKIFLEESTPSLETGSIVITSAAATSTSVGASTSSINEEYTTPKLIVEVPFETTSVKPQSSTTQTRIRGRGRGRSRFNSSYNYGNEFSSSTVSSTNVNSRRRVTTTSESPRYIDASSSSTVSSGTINNRKRVTESESPRSIDESSSSTVSTTTVNDRKKVTESESPRNNVRDEINTTQTLPMTTEEIKQVETTTEKPTDTITSKQTTKATFIEPIFVPNGEQYGEQKPEQNVEITTENDPLQSTLPELASEIETTTKGDETLSSLTSFPFKIEGGLPTTIIPSEAPKEEITTITIKPVTTIHEQYSEENSEDFTLSYTTSTVAPFTTDREVSTKFDNKEFVLSTQTIEEIETNTGSIAEINLSTNEVDTATTIVTTSTTTAPATTNAHRRRIRPNSRIRTRHRFGSDAVTTRPSRRKPPDKSHSTETVERIPSTDASLYKSANPTQAETAKETPSTTPLSVQRHFIFNCFGKVINRFYSDPRDCRLFHYCTNGFNKNQLLDMKFVCDLGTYFDDEKLICTKEKPTRCI